MQKVHNNAPIFELMVFLSALQVTILLFITKQSLCVRLKSESLHLHYIKEEAIGL